MANVILETARGERGKGGGGGGLQLHDYAWLSSARPRKGHGASIRTLIL